MRPQISKALAEQQAQQLEYLRRTIRPIDVSTIARASTEQLCLTREPAIKQVALAAIHEEALRLATRQASGRAFAAMDRYDWRAISGNLISEAGKLLAEVGAKDRFDELQRAAEASVATAREQEPAQQLDEDQASDAREGHPEENLHDLVAELIAQVRISARRHAMQLPGGRLVTPSIRSPLASNW